MYNKRIMQYYHKKDQYCQTIENPDFCVSGKNSVCGDELAICGEIKNNKIARMSVTGTGCIISQAAAVMLTERIIGMTFEQVKNFSANDMKQLFDMPVGPNRMACALLALEVLHKAVRDTKHD